MVPKVGDAVRFNPEFVKFLRSRGDTCYAHSWGIDLKITVSRRDGDYYLVKWDSQHGHNYTYIDQSGVHHSAFGPPVFVPAVCASPRSGGDPLCPECNVPMEYGNFAYKCPKCWKRTF